MGRNATSKIGVNAVTGRGYNPQSRRRRDSSPCMGESRSGAAPITFVHVYNYYFRTYSVYLSFRLFAPFGCKNPPPSSEGGKAAPPHATESVLWYISIKMCAHGAHTFTFCPKGKKYNLPKGQI